MNLRLEIVLVYITFFAAGVITVGGAEVCKLQVDDVLKNDHVLTVVEKNGDLELLLTDTIPVNKHLFLACSSEDGQIVKCLKTGNFSADLKTLENCDKRLSVIISKSNDECGPGAKYITFGYDILYKKHKKHLEIYRTCYSATDVRTLYSEHSVQDHSIGIHRPEAYFQGGYIISQKTYLMYKQDKIFDTFVHLLGEKQKYIPDRKTTVIARGHLTPSGDFPYPELMKSTFQYVNVVPQFQIINISNWKRIENWIKQIIKNEGNVKVVTGTFDVLKLPHSTENRLVPMYLKPGDNELDQIPIPKWMFKIIKTNNMTYVFVTYNNPFADSLPEPICKIISCPQDINNSTWDDRSKGYTYCCNIADFKKTVPVPKWV